MNSTTITASRADSPSQATRTTGWLLHSGVLAGPLFIAVILIQELTRPGFDPKRHPLSLLSLGEQGWIQITNFIVAGLLALAGAVGIRRILHPGRAGTWGPILIGTYGVGLILGGVFLTDPYDGYPPGTPAGMPEHLSWHGTLHSIAPVVAILSLIVACLVFARRFAGQGQRGWATYSIATVLANIALTSASFTTGDFRFLFAGGALVWIWAAVITAQLRNTSNTDR